MTRRSATNANHHASADRRSGGSTAPAKTPRTSTPPSRPSHGTIATPVVRMIPPPPAPPPRGHPHPLHCDSGHGEGGDSLIGDRLTGKATTSQRGTPSPPSPLRLRR